MYLQNKYSNVYFNIIKRAKSRELPKESYKEKHHVIPKSLGGTNDQDNIVSLTAREHFICHLLLPKMITGIEKRSMSFALWSMITMDHSTSRKRYKINSRLFETIKIQVAAAKSELHKGKIVSAETRKKISDAQKGKPSPNKGKLMSEEQKQKMRDTIAINGRTISPETRRKISESNTGYKHSAEAKKKISESQKGQYRKPISQEHKDSISQKLTGIVRSTETKIKMSDSKKGKPRSEETKKKISESRKLLFSK